MSIYRLSYIQRLISNIYKYICFLWTQSHLKKPNQTNPVKISKTQNYFENMNDHTVITIKKDELSSKG